MEIIPRLYLTNNVKHIPNGSIVSAKNLTLNDNGLLQVEYAAKSIDIIRNTLNEKYKDKYYDIIYCVECSQELVLFVKDKNEDNYLSIFRYNEVENKCIFIINNFEYHNGKFTSTFTYNKNNLIIAISEYLDDDSLNIPLRILNLGEFNEELNNDIKNVLIDNTKHSINPEVIIPKINYKFITGNTYKGWHHIFIRYKISNNNYTQWFYTNNAILLDSVGNNTLSKYTVRDTNNIDLNSSSYIQQILSNDSDICQNTYKLIVNNLDNRYNYYQIGVLINFKTQIKSFISDDIIIGNNSIIFNNFNEYNNSSLLEKYSNYYNIKTLDSFNNKLYIGNYSELNDIIDVSNITLTLNAFKKEIDYDLVNGDIEESDIVEKSTYVKYKEGSDNIITEKHKYKNYSGEYEYIRGICVRREYNENRDKYTYTDYLDGDKTIYIIFNLYKKTQGSSSYTELIQGHYIVKTNIKNLCIINNGNQSSYYNFVLSSSNDGMQETTPWDKFFISSPPLDTYYIPIDSHITILTEDEFEESAFNEYSLEFNETDYLSYNALKFERNIDFNTNNINLLDYNYNNWDWNYVDNNTEINNVLNINKINTFNIDINEYYSFYVHFINKYGETTRGIPIHKFDLKLNQDYIAEDYEKNIDIKIKFNRTSKKLIYFKEDNELVAPNNYEEKYVNYIKVKINQFPKNYIGYFISYEEIDKRIYYKGFGKKIDNPEYNFEFYCEKFNIEDAISLNINKLISLHATIGSLKNSDVGDSVRSLSFNKDDKIALFNINNKSLVVADEIESNNEYVGSTKLFLKIKDLSVSDGIKFCMLLNDDFENKYINTNNLIPCSKISYNTNDDIIINTKNAITTDIKYLYYPGNIYFDSGELKFKDSTDINKKIISPYFLLKYKFYDDLPYEVLTYRNKPDIKIFPATSTTNTKGRIIELKDTIDLYKQNHVPYYKSNLIVLDYLKDDIKYSNKFTNTIRRSNPILDESYEVSWRKFEINAYKNISENKGAIIKVINMNNSILIHNEHGLFILDGSDSIKSATDGKIQLSSIDIWDVNIKELISSKLGYGGLSKLEHSVVGEFGYFWYNNYDFFYIDNKFAVTKVTDDIKDFIGNGENLINVETLFIDKTNDRIIIKFLLNDGNIFDKLLTFNYKTKTFISFIDGHNSWRYYNTKSKTYRVSTFNTKTNSSIATYNLTKGRYINDDCISSISILFNNDYKKIKVLDSVLYKIKKKIIPNIPNIDILNWINQELDYAGCDFIRVRSEYCDTNTMEVSMSKDTVNNPEYKYAPYWHLGNWHFNFIRNAKINNELKDSYDIDSSLVYGNYFILTLEFYPIDLIQIESVDFNTKPL